MTASTMLLRVLNDNEHLLAPVGSLDRQEQLSAFLTRKLEKIENDQKSFVLGCHRIVIQEETDKAVKIVMFVKDFVSSAVSAEPHAALAWAGVCVFLPVFLPFLRLPFPFVGKVADNRTLVTSKFHFTTRVCY